MSFRVHYISIIIIIRAEESLGKIHECSNDDPVYELRLSGFSFCYIPSGSISFDTIRLENSFSSSYTTTHPLIASHTPWLVVVVGNYNFYGLWRGLNNMMTVCYPASPALRTCRRHRLCISSRNFASRILIDDPDGLILRLYHKSVVVVVLWIICE